MKVVFLGTAGSAPVEGHRLPSILVENRFLLDCGEGVTEALCKMGLFNEIEAVFLTHMHGDHVSGIISLIWTYMLKGRRRKLLVAGPRGTADALIKLLKAVNTPMDRIRSFVAFKDLEPSEDLGYIKVCEARHPIPSLAFRVDLNGISLCYTGDTSPSPKVVELAKGCDLLIHDSTFPPDMEKEALSTGHSTARQAGEIATKAGVRMLALFHLPYYYYENDVFLKDFLKAAKEAFSGKVFVPEEMKCYNIV